MPTVKLAPPPRQQFEDANGNPYVGAKLFTYAAGSTTKQATYTDSTGTTANANPIILDSAGRTPYGLWLASGLFYKFVLAPATDTDPPTSPIFTEDVITGINDTTTPAALATSAQWVASGLTPTYVNATQFTLTGDQRSAFHVGRRLRLTVTAGTVYGEISVSAFTALTTVTVVLDSGVLDSGLSVVDVGIVTAVNSAIPKAQTLGAQPLDATLTNFASQVFADNEIPVGTAAADVFAKLTLDTDGTLAANSDVKLATQKAVKTYADTKTSLSSFTGANQSLAANGYQKLPGGLILQWGTVAVAARGSWETDFGLITLPVAFPTAALSASATVLSTDAAVSIEGYGGIKSISLTQINPIVGSTVVAAGNYGVYWQAIGY